MYEEDKEYYFDEEHIIIAYNDTVLAGVFITHPNETLTKTELMNCFRGVNLTYLIAAKLPTIEKGDITPEKFQAKLTHIMEDLSENIQDRLDVEYYIPRTLH